MSNMKIITEKEYRDFIKFRDELSKLILEKTSQLSLMLYNKLPKGTCYNYDFEEKDGKICVQFESYGCQETNYDTFYLPLEFLFDESYSEKYKLIWEEEKCKEKEEKERKLKEKEEHQKRVMEEYERKEYARLKLKYEYHEVKIESNSSNSIYPFNIDKIWDKDDDKL